MTSNDSPRKLKILEYSNRTHPDRDAWIHRNRYFYNEDTRYMKFLVHEGLRVLDLGCGTGHLLDALKPGFGVGVDFSHFMLEKARNHYPGYTFILGDIDYFFCIYFSYNRSRHCKKYTQPAITFSRHTYRCW